MLDRKLLRDLRRMWVQALAIALVLAGGVATYVLASGAYHSLEETRRAYYERYRFGDIFAEIKRAPRYVGEQIRAIEGVAAADLRISQFAILDVPNLIEPATGRVVSIPERTEGQQNRLHIRAGRLPEFDRRDEVVVNEAFATANKLQLGDTFRALLNGKLCKLSVVGIALSPEFIYAIGPGDLVPDDRRFAVIWMSDLALGGIFDLEGAFNSVSVRLLRDSNAEQVIATLDAILAQYGGTGAYRRKDQFSHAFLDAELAQLAAMRRVIPPIFLLVSAFLINMILTRAIALEREQIGLLKAIGYGPLAIATHYTKFVLAIAIFGICIGFVTGAWLGRGVTKLYSEFFHFPFLIFRHDASTYAAAGAVSAGAAIVGALRAVNRILRLAPAVAMQPPTPPRYNRGLAAHIHTRLPLSQMTIMSLRHMARWPTRIAVTVLGIALAGALLVMALLSFDSVESMVDVAFFRIDRQHATISFNEPQHVRALESVQRLPGVLRVESLRTVPVRLRNGHRVRRLSIAGKPPEMDLSRILDADLRPIVLPSHGVVIDARVAELLQLKRGDMVEVEVLEGRRTQRSVVVTDVITNYLGLSAFMDLAALSDFLEEGPRVSGAHISYDAQQESALFAAVKSTPALSSISLQKRSISRFRATIEQNINYMVTVYVSLAVIMAFGVVYNSARIQLSEHAREIASLRVLGFTRNEVSRLLLTETVVVLAIAVPLGWLIGYGFGWLLIQAFSSDLYRVPFTIEHATYAKASLVVIVATLASMMIVRRRVNRLDLISVLKARD